MHFKIQTYCYIKAMFWIDIYHSDEPCELFNDNSEKIGFRIVKIISDKHCVIDDIDYLMIPETQDIDDKKQMTIDNSGKFTILIARSSSLRKSNIWP